MSKVINTPKKSSYVDITGPSTVFGDFSVAQDTPAIQIDALRGILSSEHETFTASNGAVNFKTDHGGKEFECSIDTTVGSYALLRSKRVLRYRPGQGIKMRYTARFNTPVALLAQRAGGIGVGTELSFGYDGSNGFGILHRTGGRLEIRKLTFSVAAGGSETATITLDGTAYTVSLTAGTTAFNSFQVSQDSDFGSGNTWEAIQNDGTVLFIKQAVGTANGTYSFSSNGTATASFTQVCAGSAPTDNWVYQTEWDVSDPFGDGSFDPTKGNIYQVEFGYLGYANIHFYIYNPYTSNWVRVHSIKWPNNNTNPHLDIPHFKLGWFCASLGSSTAAKIYGASAAGFISGISRPLANPIAHANTKTSVTTTLTNILSIRVRKEFAGFVNLAQVLPAYISAAVDGTKPAQIEVHLNPTLGGTPNWTYHGEDESLVEYDTASTTVTGGREIAVFSLGKAGDRILDLRGYGVTLDRGDVMTVAVQATSGTTDASVSISWLED